jgi:serine/threonine protein kinase
VLTDKDRPFCATVDDICQLIGILEKAHARGVVHRDLNFSNMFLDRLHEGQRTELRPPECSITTPLFSKNGWRERSMRELHETFFRICNEFYPVL